MDDMVDIARKAQAELLSMQLDSFDAVKKNP